MLRPDPYDPSPLPDLGRFLQPDPIGFKGDASNLYRYCGNDWANRTDPMGTQEILFMGEVPPALLETELPRPIIENVAKEGTDIPKEMIDEAIRLNRGKNEVRLPDGRRVGLRGKDHFSKRVQRPIRTPHVRDPKKFDPPYDKLHRATERDPREAKPDDIRDVIRHLQDKLNEGKGEKARPDITTNQGRGQSGQEKPTPDAKQQEPQKESPKQDITPDNAEGQPGQSLGTPRQNG